MKKWLLLYLFFASGCEIEPLGFSSWEFFDASQGIRTSEDVMDAQADMIELVFGGPLPTRLPDDIRFHADPAFASYLVERLVVETDDLSSVVYLIHPPSWNGGLAIYHQGHGGDFRVLGAETIFDLLDAEYQVLAFSMPMLGMNTHPFATDEHVELSVRDHPLRYFIDPVVVALNWAEETYAYSRRFMVGLSGGGWTAVVAAAIDERIDASYPVAASWPHYLRELYGSFGDWEERITPNYLELYLMATHPGRAQTQIFNELDPCCFSGTYALDYLAYTSYHANAWGGRFQILIDHDQMEHVISSYSREQILELEGAAR